MLLEKSLSFLWKLRSVLLSFKTLRVLQSQGVFFKEKIFIKSSFYVEFLMSTVITLQKENIKL